MSGTAPSRYARRLLEVAGMLEPRGVRFPALYRLYSWYCFLAMGYLCCGCIAFIIINPDLIGRLSSIGIFITILNGFVKHQNTLFHQAETSSLLDQFELQWDRLQEVPMNRILMDPITNISRKLFKAYFYFLTVLVSLNMTVPLLLYFLIGFDQPAFQVTLPFQKRWNFAVAHLVFMAMTVCPAVTNLAHSFLYFALSKQLAFFISVVRRELREGPISRKLIQSHQQVILLTNNVNNRFAHLLYFETNTVSIECSCTGYIVCKANILSGKFDNFIPRMVNFVFCYLIPYIICYCGDIIKSESEGLLRAAYSGPWYQKGVEERKDLRLVMLAAKRPLTLHYRNLAVFSMGLFLAILNSTYTFLNAIVWLEKAGDRMEHK